MPNLLQTKNILVFLSEDQSGTDVAFEGKRCECPPKAYQTREVAGDPTISGIGRTIGKRRPVERCLRGLSRNASEA
jgi:hypothetical protein